MAYIVKDYKLTWLNPLEPYKLNSKFFDSEVDAVLWLNLEQNKYIRKQGYMILQMKEYNDGQYTWKVLPYGDYKGYKYGMLVDYYKWEILIIFAIIGYYLYQKK